MVQVPSLSESPSDDQGHGVPASAYQGGMEGVDSEISWDRQVEEADEWCSVRSPENRDGMEGDCEDLGEYPSGHSPSILWDLGHRSWDHTYETDEAQEVVVWEEIEAQQVYSRSKEKDTIG
jgi:hypothetical protein